jgi:hypothetical protein
MEEKKLFAGEIIYFYLHNIFSLSFLRRNFSENIFFNVSMNLNSIFLILKTLTYDLKFKKHCQWLILFLKRQIIFFSRKYKKLNIIKLLETLIEISVCSDIIVYPLLEDNLEDGGSRVKNREYEIDSQWIYRRYKDESGEWVNEPLEDGHWRKELMDAAIPNDIDLEDENNDDSDLIESNLTSETSTD